VWLQMANFGFQRASGPLKYWEEDTKQRSLLEEADEDDQAVHAKATRLVEHF